MKTEVEQTFSGEWLTRRKTFEQSFNVSMKKVYHILWVVVMCGGLAISAFGWYKASKTYQIKIEKVTK